MNMISIASPSPATDPASAGSAGSDGLRKKRIVCCELNNGVTYVNQSAKTGLVVPPRDPEARAIAINDLLANEQKRHAYGKEAYDRVRQEFTLKQMTEGTLAVYRSILGPQNARK